MPASIAPVAELLTSADRIADVLKNRIVRGEIAGGMPLRQDYIAEEFGSSHVPVREAFARLEAQGLVFTQPRRGVRVTVITAGSIKETVEMRNALEVIALRHSAPKFNDTHLAVIEEAHERCDKATSLIEWDAANCAFHDGLISECGMPRLLATLKQLQLANSRYLFAVGQLRGWQPRSDHDHRLIINALKEKNIERACQLLTRHIGTMERVGFSSITPK